MGQPAARIGDMCAHGGALVVGCPTVLIGGMPAARLGDMHVCPMVTPAVPPIPHVGGPVLKGSAGVLIGGMPAARMGDLALCTGPPDTIVLGCMTVLIGETMAGGGGGGGAGAGAPASVAAQASAASALTDNLEASTKDEHWVNFEFVDKAGNPVSGIHYGFTDSDGKESKGVLRTDGRIKRDAINQGQCKAVLYTVSNAKWSKDKADVGEKVKLSADVLGFKDGTKATIEIYKRDITGPDVVFDTIELKVQGGKVETEWEYVLLDPDLKELKKADEEEPRGYSAPEYYFDVVVENCKAHSGILSYKDWIEIKLKYEDGNVIANKKFTMHLSSGEIRKGTLDSNGSAKIEDVPPGEVKISIDPRKK